MFPQNHYINPNPRPAAPTSHPARLPVGSTAAPVNIDIEKLEIELGGAGTVLSAAVLDEVVVDRLGVSGGAA